MKKFLFLKHYACSNFTKILNLSRIHGTSIWKGPQQNWDEGAARSKFTNFAVDNNNENRIRNRYPFNATVSMDDSIRLFIIGEYGALYTCV
jgi:hypothetical protein